MMREIVAGLTGVFLVLYIYWFYMPLLSNTHTAFNNPLLVNASDSTVQMSYNLGNGFYTIAPLVPIFVCVFIWISVALKNESVG